MHSNTREPLRETERLAALHSYRILDTAPERGFDDLVEVAARLFDTPIALVSLVDEHRQWFKARVGLEEEQTPRELAFCRYTIQGDDPFVVNDAAADERFRDNPLVTSPPNIRFYAGAPLLVQGGHRVGSLCVIDRVAREANREQLELLVRLARLAADLMESRRVAGELAEALERAKVLEGLLPICIHCHRVRGDDDSYREELEAWVRENTGKRISHGLCEHCLEEHYEQ